MFVPGIVSGAMHYSSTMPTTIQMAAGDPYACWCGLLQAQARHGSGTPRIDNRQHNLPTRMCCATQQTGSDTHFTAVHGRRCQAAAAALLLTQQACGLLHGAACAGLAGCDLQPQRAVVALQLQLASLGSSARDVGLRHLQAAGVRIRSVRSAQALQWGGGCDATSACDTSATSAPKHPRQKRPELEPAGPAADQDRSCC